jgi:hypothetical protein
VTLASGTNSGSPVAAPTAGVAALSSATQLLAQSLTNCYTLPLSQRVTLDTNNRITSIADECKNFATSAGIPAGAPAFKQNGYALGSFFYLQLTNAAMTGAKFSVPEIMAFYPATALPWHKTSQFPIRQ